MIRGGFLSPDDRADLICLARDGSAAHRLTRRANALVLLDNGWNCEQVSAALFVDDDTVRRWHRGHPCTNIQPGPLVGGRSGAHFIS